MLYEAHCILMWYTYSVQVLQHCVCGGAVQQQVFQFAGASHQNSLRQFVRYLARAQVETKFSGQLTNFYLQYEQDPESKTYLKLALLRKGTLDQQLKKMQEKIIRKIENVVTFDIVDIRLLMPVALSPSIELSIHRMRGHEWHCSNTTRMRRADIP